jgi:uncharacterized protein (DUF1697 family)
VPIYVGLLRAVNVSGQNRVPMADLRAALEGAGLRDVETYVQSGNLVFEAEGDDAAEQAAAVHGVIEGAFGLDVTVLALAATELARVAAENPFLADADEKALHVTFLERPVDAAAFAGLKLPAAPGEAAALAASGRLVYLHLPHGYGRTKLNNSFFERHLGTKATTRNWNTITKLLELAGR